MWWNMAPDMKSEFENWHSHEHFPERLSVPGFRRSTRWTSAEGDEGIFVIYELEDHQVLSSPGYLARLNDPTPWSRKLMPYHKGMVRCQSHVLASHGSLTARFAMTIRITPMAGEAERLSAALSELIGQLADRPGLTGAHLLRHETPAIAQTTEQKIRSTPDQVSDFVLLVTAYEEAPLQALGTGALADEALQAMGAEAGSVRDVYSLSHSAIASDVR
jgi:hypothetical protein